MRPTLRFRWYERRHAYRIETYFYESREAIPVRTLQQWWEWPEGKDDQGYPADGEWRDVPIEVE